MEAATGKTILIVEDERDVVDLLTLNLRKSGGFNISTALDGAAGLEKARSERPAFLILDLMLPKLSGLEVCKILKSDPETRHIPIMMLTAKAEEIDRIVGLEFGADDYVTKPFDTAELLARVRVAQRRSLTETGDPVFNSGSLCVDFSARQVKLGGVEIKLTPTEYSLLRVLVQNAGKVVTHRQLLRTVWGEKAESQAQYLRVYVTHLRKKLQTDAREPSLIKTEMGIGYRLSTERL